MLRQGSANTLKKLVIYKLNLNIDLIVLIYSYSTIKKFMGGFLEIIIQNKTLNTHPKNFINF